MKPNKIQSLSQIALTRLVSQKKGIDYLKNYPMLCTPKLSAMIYENLVQADQRFTSYLPRQTRAHLDRMTFNECENVMRRCRGSINEVKKLRCYDDSTFRMFLIDQDYTLFLDLANRTDDEWKRFFYNVPIDKLEMDQPDEIHRQVKLLVITRIDFAIVTRPELLRVVDNLTLDMILSYKYQIRQMHHWFNYRGRPTPKNLYVRIRAVINQTAENQLASIKAGLNDVTIRHYDQQVSSEQNLLYTEFKSIDCIYEWVKRGGYLEKLPLAFATKIVFFEIIRLGNSSVFKNLPFIKIDQPVYGSYYTSKPQLLNMTTDLCIECLTIEPGLIEFVKHLNQTAAMKDVIMNRYPKGFRYIAKHLLTLEDCRVAIIDNVENFCLIDQQEATIKLVVDRLCDGFELKSTVSYTHVGKYIKNDIDLQWLLAKKCQNPRILEKLILWLDNKVIEYIIFNRSYSDINIAIRPHLAVLATRLNMGTLQTMIVKHPKLIGKAYIPITPAMIKSACRQKIDVFNLIPDTLIRKKIFDMIFEDRELFCYAYTFAHGLYLDRPVSFRECAILFSGAQESHLLSILNILSRANHWLLFQCFYMACYSASTFKLLPCWRQNVALLGDVTEFDVRAMALVLSFDVSSGPKDLEEKIKHTNFFRSQYSNDHTGDGSDEEDSSSSESSIDE